jgi:hypothetical protein
MTPTARSLALLRRAGFLADVVERWIPRANVRRDLFGIGDVLAVHPRRREILLLQVTSGAHVGDRLAKVRERPALKVWLLAGGQFEVWGWLRRGDRWRVKRLAIRDEDLKALPVVTVPRRSRSRPQPMFFDLAGQAENKPAG